MVLSTPTLASAPRVAVDRAVAELQPALDVAPTAMALVSLAGRYLEVNAAMCALLGRPAADVRGASTADFTHPDDVAASAQGFDVSPGVVHAVAKRYVRPGGEVVHALRYSRLLSDPAGRPLLYCAHVVDITERWAAERGLADLGRAALDGASGPRLRLAAERVVAGALGVGADEAAAALDRVLGGDTSTTALGDAASIVLGAANVLASASQRRAAEDEVRRQALHDPLTGLPNRLLLLDRIRGVVSAARRRGAALLLLDLDGFKAINDTYGHAQGDALLREVAHRIRRAVRPEDTVVRLGGDEFAVLLGDVVDVVAAEDVARRIVAEVDQPFTRGRTVMGVGASIGITYTRDPRATMEKLLGDADVAMYAAKASGRNRTVVYTEELRSAAARQGRLEAELARAIAEDQLELHYQPVVRLDGTWVGVEALVRWRHPERGLLPPVEFIPLAEACGLIVPLGRWVLDHALTEAARWRSGAPRGGEFSIAVNISACQLVPGFADVVLAAVERSGLPASALVLEMTETMLMERAEAEYAELMELRRHGVHIAIDDFGTGYSSLSYLVRLPVDIVKLDRSFTAGLVRDPREASVVRAVTGLVRDLGLLLVAEGVEQEEQVVALRELGCKLAQGWHFDRALPAAEVDRRLGLGPGR